MQCTLHAIHEKCFCYRTMHTVSFLSRNTLGNVMCVHANTVWPEILAGRYFGGLLKICHLAEFTLAVEPVLAIMIFIAKWLIERAGNLTGP